MYVRDEKHILIENRWNLPLSWMPDYGRNVGAVARRLPISTQTNSQFGTKPYYH